MTQTRGFEPKKHLINFPSPPGFGHAFGRVRLLRRRLLGTAALQQQTNPRKPAICRNEQLKVNQPKTYFRILPAAIKFVEQQLHMEEQNLLNEFEEPKYQFVGFWSRFGARFIDGIILAIVSWPLNEIGDSIDSLPLIAVLSFIPFFYHPLMEYKFGASIGKMALGIKVVNYEFQKLTISNVLLRNIFFLAIEIISVGMTLFTYNAFQTIGDEGGFRSMTDIFTPEVTSYMWFALAVFLFYIAEAIVLANDEKYRSIHDRTGKTYVVRKTY